MDIIEEETPLSPGEGLGVRPPKKKPPTNQGPSIF
jgi:hypothetical protein